MNIEITDHQGNTMIGLSGDIDMYSSPDLREKLMALIKERVPLLFVDFRGVSYIDSSGMATFVEGLKCMRAYGGRLQFFGMSPGIVEIFTFSKLDRVFEMYPTVDDAIRQ